MPFSCYDQSHVWHCLFVMFLYIPSQHLWSWRDGQFTYPHLFRDKLEQAVNQCFVHILALVTDNNPSSMTQRKGGDDHRNYFMINLHERMGPGWDRTRIPLICSLAPVARHITNCAMRPGLALFAYCNCHNYCTSFPMQYSVNEKFGS